MNIPKLSVTRLTSFLLAVAIGMLLSFFIEYGLQQYRIHTLSVNDAALMELLNERIVLPSEIPSIATVTDKEKLLEQPFFAKAENGDKVIVYSESRRAYLFRPSEQKIIDMTVIAVATPRPDAETVPVFRTPGQ